MKNVLEWLEQTARRIPDKVMIADEDSSLTFDELKGLSRRYGTFLHDHVRVRPREAVAFYLEKSPQAFAAMLGSVYAGAFYSVIDTRHPASRVRAICETLEPAVVLVDEAHLAQAHELFDGTPWLLLSLEEALAGEANDAALAAVRAQAQDTDPLYAVYTSGSTGTPKGVLAAHRSVLDFIPAFDAAVGITERDIHGNQAPFDYDASVKDLYSSLRCGSRVQLVPRELFMNPTGLMDYLADHACTTLVWAVGAMSFVSVMRAFDYRVPTSVNKVLFSGEVMPPKLLRYWMQHLADARYVNLYGPTETLCNCSYFIVDRAYGDDEAIPIGGPFDNGRVILLDEGNREIREPLVQGEICVAGSGLTLGYLNDPERTAAAYMPNPANTRWNETIYRTGDIGFRREDGELMYVSRKDNQIKHLGHRIELGDIEAAALGVDGVSQACCIYDTRRQKLRLFYAGELSKGELVDRLHELLPPYMIPNTTRQLEALPLTSSGKIDRKGLATARGRRARQAARGSAAGATTPESSTTNGGSNG